MRKILIRALLKIISIILSLTLKLFLIKDFSKKDRKFLQPYLIRKSNEFQRKIFKSINFPLTVKYDSSKDIFYCGYPDPIMLRTDYTNKYYKSLSSSKITNEAEIFSDLINKEKSNNIIDIGSCFGEISIFFAKNFKKSKIFSIEGSTENFKVLKHNIKINNISNIIFENSIISDNNDTHYISNYRGAENYVSKDQKDNFTKVKTLTLTNFIRNHEIDHIDFIKIDIEGSVPFLSKDLISLNKENRISNIMIAIEKNSYENYFQILDSFGKSMHMYNLDYKNSRLIPIDLNDFLSDIKNNLPNKYTQDNKWAKDILFTKIKIN